MPAITVIKLRRDTAANWDSTNPVLAAGEQGLETDTGLMKIGDGTSAWGALPYQAVSRMVQTVKNTSGSSMSKGSVVYISGATGGDVQVSLADADTEATSSKTIGLLTEAIANDGFGEVLYEGLLSGINTASATAGQSVWLSSTAGGFVFNAPPAKPAHSVYLGVVTRAHATEGEILVKVQNGYEINELHDVNITGTVADNEVLAYDDASSMWINQTAAEAGLATADHTHTIDSLLPSQTGNSGEFLITNGSAASWSNTVTSNSTTAPAIVARAVTSQTAALQEWRDPDNVLKAFVSSDGIIAATGGVGGAYAALQPVGRITATAGSSAIIPLAIYGAASQSANLQVWGDNAEAVLASISASGQLTAVPATPANTASATNVGFVGMPQVSTSTGLTISASHAGRHIYSTTTGITHTIPANASVPLQIGTTIVFINPASVSTSIAITSDTLILAGTGTTGTRTLAAHGMATAVKVAATTWYISGNGLS